MNRVSQKRGVLQVLLAAIVAAFICSKSSVVAAQPVPTASQCEEYNHPIQVHLTRAVPASLLLAGAWEGLSNSEARVYWNGERSVEEGGVQGVVELPQRFVLARGFPTLSAARGIGPRNWLSPGADGVMVGEIRTANSYLTIRELVCANPANVWDAHADLVERFVANQAVEARLTAAVSGVVQVTHITDTQRGLVLQRSVQYNVRINCDSNASHTLAGLFVGYEAVANDADAYSHNWSITVRARAGANISVPRAGARRPINRACNGLERFSQAVESEDPVLVTEVLSNLDGVDANLDATPELRTVVRSAKTTLKQILSRRRKPDQRVIDVLVAYVRQQTREFNRQQDTIGKFRARDEMFKAYGVLSLGVLAWILLSFAAIRYRRRNAEKPTTTPPPSAPLPDEDHRDSRNPPAVVLHTTPNPQALQAEYDRGYAAAKGTFAINDPRAEGPDAAEKFLLGSGMLKLLLDETRAAAKAEGVTEGKSTMTFVDPDGEKILDQGRINALLSEAHAKGESDGKISRDGEVGKLTKRISRLEAELATSAAFLKDAWRNMVELWNEPAPTIIVTTTVDMSWTRELVAERDGLKAKVNALTIFARDVHEIVMGGPAALNEDGDIVDLAGAADRIEAKVAELRRATSEKLEVALDALRQIRDNASKGPKFHVAVAKRGLGERTKGAPERTPIITDPGTPTTAQPGDGMSESGVVRHTAPEAPAAAVTTAELIEELGDEVIEIEVDADVPANTATPLVVDENFAGAAEIFRHSFRAFYDGLLTGERTKLWSPGCASIIGKVMAGFRVILMRQGHEAEAASLLEAFKGCPEITWADDTPSGSGPSGATKVDVVSDARSPARLALDRYAAVASAMQRIINGESQEVSADPNIKKMFDSEMTALAADLGTAGMRVAQAILINGLSKSRSSAKRTAARPMAAARPPAIAAEGKGTP